jgi:hypothetical protein
MKTAMGVVDYRLLGHWEASQRSRRLARAEAAAADAELEAALVRALRHIDRRRAELGAREQLLDVDDR